MKLQKHHQEVEVGLLVGILVKTMGLEINHQHLLQGAAHKAEVPIKTYLLITCPQHHHREAGHNLETLAKMLALNTTKHLPICKMCIQRGKWTSASHLFLHHEVHL